MSISFGHGLALTYFKVQKQTSSGGWTIVSLLNKDQKYRFKLIFKNTNSNSFIPPLTEPHVYLDLYYIGITKASYEEYYESSSYSKMITGPGGIPSNYTSIYGSQIQYQKSGTYYFYFIWRCPSDIALPLPGIKISVGINSAVFKGKPDITLVPFI